MSKFESIPANALDSAHMKSRQEHDILLMQGGAKAEFSDTERGYEEVIVPTDDQIDAARGEMQADFTQRRKENDDRMVQEGAEVSLDKNYNPTSVSFTPDQVEAARREMEAELGNPAAAEIPTAEDHLEIKEVDPSLEVKSSDADALEKVRAQIKDLHDNVFEPRIAAREAELKSAAEKPARAETQPAVESSPERKISSVEIYQSYAEIGAERLNRTKERSASLLKKIVYGIGFLGGKLYSGIKKVALSAFAAPEMAKDAMAAGVDKVGEGYARVGRGFTETISSIGKKAEGFKESYDKKLAGIQQRARERKEARGFAVWRAKLGDLKAREEAAKKKYQKASDDHSRERRAFAAQAGGNPESAAA